MISEAEGYQIYANTHTDTQAKQDRQAQADSLMAGLGIVILTV